MTLSYNLVTKAAYSHCYVVRIDWCYIIVNGTSMFSYSEFEK